MTTQIFQASTLYQAISLAAGIKAGHFGPASTRRLLLVANNSMAPELTTDLDDMLGAAPVIAAFDSVVSWNDAIWPHHPKTFGVSPTDSIGYNRRLRADWDLGSDDVELVVESLPGDPAGCLTSIFHDSPIMVHSDGLMSYGPIRKPLGRAQYQRLTGVYYPDLVPGLRPVQLSEHRPAYIRLEREDFRAMFADVAQSILPTLREHGLDRPIPGTALLLGQYLSAISLVSPEEELALQKAMVRRAVEAGARHILFKPHPTATRAAVTTLKTYAREVSAELRVLDLPVSAEVLFETVKPELVLSNFSTALATARYVFGIDTHASGTERLLDAIAPYQNSNRIPVTLIDALFTRGDSTPEQGNHELQTLVEAVAYCMQPTILHELRPRTEAYLAGLAGRPETRYFKRRRLTKLDLPGRLPPRPLHVRAAQNAARKVYRELPPPLQQVAKRARQRLVR